MSTSNKIGLGWKPMDKLGKNRSMVQDSQSRFQPSNGSLPRPKGRVPPMLSNGQSALIRKRDLLTQTSKKNQVLKQPKKFNVLSIDHFASHVKKEPFEPIDPSTITPSSTNTSNSKSQSASSMSTGASQQMAENITTSQIDNSNKTTIKDESNDYSIVPMNNNKNTKEKNESISKLKKKIIKLEAKLKGYKQNELIFRKNTAILTDEIYENQFAMAKVYGELATLKENNQNLNNFQDYLINDLINTKLDYKKVKENLVKGIRNHFSTVHQKEQESKINNLIEDKSLSSIIKKENGKKYESVPLPDKIKESENHAKITEVDEVPKAVAVNNTSTTTMEPISSKPTPSTFSTVTHSPSLRSSDPTILAETIPINNDKSTSSFSELINSKENQDNIVTKNALYKLECGILKRVTEFEQLEKSLHEQIKRNEESSEIIDISPMFESPYVKRLKNTIVTLHKDLKSVHTILNNRTINFQLLLNKSEKSNEVLKQKNVSKETEMKDYILKSQTYMKNASIHIKKLEKEREEVVRTLTDLKAKFQQQNSINLRQIQTFKANNNINNNNNNNSVIVQDFQKMETELKSSQNLCLSQQNTIEILSRELYNAKTELATASSYNNTVNNGEFVPPQMLLDKQKREYETKMQMMNSNFTREITGMKSQYVTLFNQYTQLKSQTKNQIDPKSPEVVVLLKKERIRFSNDIKSCLDIILKEASLKDKINYKDVANAIDLLNLVTTKLVEAASTSKTQPIVTNKNNTGSANVSKAPVKNQTSSNNSPANTYNTRPTIYSPHSEVNKSNTLSPVSQHETPQVATFNNTTTPVMGSPGKATATAVTSTTPLQNTTPPTSATAITTTTTPSTETKAAGNSSLKQDAKEPQTDQVSKSNSPHLPSVPPTVPPFSQGQGPNP